MTGNGTLFSTTGANCSYRITIHSTTPAHTSPLIG
jgi:hypothetical protein